MSNIPSWSLEKFASETFSSAPVPGGGGVAALCGSVGAALAGMVCNLTAGKKRYAQYEEDIRRITSNAKKIMEELTAQIDRDAENFYPLSQCYSLPSNTEEEKALKEEKMQAALKVAVSAPVEIIRLSYAAIELHGELVDKGSKLAVSDVGCVVLCLKNAMQCAWLNVMINLKSIHDSEYIRSIEAQVKPLLQKGEAMADAIYKNVEEKLAY